MKTILLRPMLGVLTLLIFAGGSGIRPAFASRLTRAAPSMSLPRQAQSPTTDASELQHVAEQFFPEISQGPMAGKFGASCYHAAPQFFSVDPPCPLSDRLLQRLDDLEAFLAANQGSDVLVFNLLCHCQNVSPARTITVDVTPSGGIAHVAMFQLPSIDLVIIRAGETLLVDDAFCTNEPSTSIYVLPSPGPCAQSG